jgi:acyl-CoA-binding protein
LIQIITRKTMMDSTGTNSTGTTPPTATSATTTMTPNVTATASEFRSKVLQMKGWIPNRPPTNRDRLELYALHKQAVASDAPETLSKSKNSKKSSPAERAKFNAWSSKRGLTQSQSMTAYIIEADRQITVYGTAPSVTPTNTPDDTTSTGASTNYGHSDTASTTTASVLLTPRGLAAVPLLCAAAAEPRNAYLKRLKANVTSRENGWWVRQEPLCGDPGTVSALPEVLVLTMAILIERLSLHLLKSDNCRNILDAFALRAAVVQSLLWPLHNVLLTVWVLVIFISTLTGSAILLLKTMLLGSKRTGVTLENIFSQEIRPSKRGAGSLCLAHQAVTIRFLGLVLYPLGIICDLADYVLHTVEVQIQLGRQSGLLFGSVTYLIACGFLWWYWFIVLPWIAVGCISLSLCLGWCFGLIELASAS